MFASTTRLVVWLGLLGTVFAQFLGPRGRPHPIHSRRAQEFTNMLTMASLMGFDISEMLMWNAIGGGGDNFMMNPVQGPAARRLGFRPPPRGLHRTLSLLGVLDGPDAPDPVGPAPKKGGGGKAGGGGGGGEREGAAPAKGGAKGRKRGRKRGKGAKRGGAGK